MPSQNESAQKEQLEAMMAEHADAPRQRYENPKTELADKAAAPRRPGMKKAPPKSTKAEQKQVVKTEGYEVAKRRRRVGFMRLKNFSPVEIAHELSIPESIVRADIEHNRKVGVDEVSQFDQARAIAETQARYREIQLKCWEDIEMAVDEEGNVDFAARVKYLELIRKTEGDLNKVLQDAGVLNKVAEKVEHKVAYELPWTPEMKQAAARAMLESVLTRQLPAPEPDIIDAELVPEEAEVAQLQNRAETVAK